MYKQFFPCVYITKTCPVLILCGLRIPSRVYIPIYSPIEYVKYITLLTVRNTMRQNHYHLPLSFGSR